MAGPRTRQKLQPRSTDVLGNLSDRYYREGNTEGMRSINQELKNRIQNHPARQSGPGEGRMILKDPSLPPWHRGNLGGGEGSFWNVRADQPWNNSGVMLALANSPATNKMKYIYYQVDPFFPDVDPIDQQIGYDFDKNLWGGNLEFGGGYDINDDAYNAYINYFREF